MDRLELEKVDFHRKVRAGYLEIALREKDRVVVIDGDQPATSIHDEIVGYVKAKTSVHF
jgi:dTMP kinase